MGKKTSKISLDVKAINQMTKALGGRAHAALFLAYLLESMNGQEHVVKADAVIRQETGLSRRMVEDSRRILTEKGWIRTVRRGMPARMHYTVHLDRIIAEVNSQFAQGEQTSLHDPCKLGKGPEKPRISFDFRTGTFRGIAEEDLDAWRRAYPAVDVQGELQRMATWLMANPHRRKKHYKRFIVNWLSSEQKRAEARSGGTLPRRTIQNLRAVKAAIEEHRRRHDGEGL